MTRRGRRFRWRLCLSLVLLVAPFALYSLRHILFGKSLSFYLGTGLRMPHDAKIVANVENYPLPESNEGEELLVFDIKAPQVAAYLAQAPWSEDSWHKGPIPNKFVENGAQIVRPYRSLWSSPRLWYTAYGKDKGYHDGELLVIDSKTNRVFLLDWDH